MVTISPEPTDNQTDPAPHRHSAIERVSPCSSPATPDTPPSESGRSASSGVTAGPRPSSPMDRRPDHASASGVPAPDMSAASTCGLDGATSALASHSGSTGAGADPTPYYSDDRATLYQADALAVLAALPTASVDALITDPPYSSGGMVRGDRAQPGSHRKYSGTFTEAGQLETFTGDSRDQRAYSYWCALWLAEAARVVRPGGVALVFTDWRQLPSTTDALQSGGWIWRGIVPWAKTAYRPQSGRFAAQCEYVVWGSAGAMPVDHSAATFPGFFQAAPPRDREHVTQKPLDVMRDLCGIVPKRRTILDPFTGSGTTGVAALMNGSHFIGAEMSEHYAEVAANRLRTVARGYRDDGQQAALEFDGGAA